MRISLVPLSTANSGLATSGEVVLDQATGQVYVKSGSSLVSKDQDLQEQIDALIDLIGGSTEGIQAQIDGLMDAITRLDWQESVSSIVEALPSSGLVAGQRHLYVGPTTGDLTTNYIYQRTDDNLAWGEVPVDAGTGVYNEADMFFYIFTGTSWSRMGVAVAHNNLNSMQGGQAGEYYHLTLAQRERVKQVTRRIDVVFNLTPTDILAKRVQLQYKPFAPSAVTVVPHGGPPQANLASGSPAPDFQVLQSGSAWFINWSGLGLDGVLEAGDQLLVSYETYHSDYAGTAP